MTTQLVKKEDKGAAGAVVLFLLFGLSFLPIWRSGLKYNLNAWQFLINHTVLSSDPVEFIPREDYMTIFSNEAPQ